MLFKPFKPPLLVKKPTVTSESTPRPDTASPPPLKKRRLSPEQDRDIDGAKRFHPQITPVSSQSAYPRSAQHFTVPQHRPDSLQNRSETDETPGGAENYYNVLWRKPTNKKHKTWDGDAVLVVVNGHARLQDDYGRDIARSRCPGPLLAGSTLSMGGKELEVESIISKDAYLAGRKYLGTAGKPNLKELDEALRTNIKFNSTPKDSKTILQSRPSVPQHPKPSAPTAPPPRPTQTLFKNPLHDDTARPTGPQSKPVPRHDPLAPNALVMKRPDPGTIPKGKQCVDVVVDPLICKNLRDHQREGVKFMYECVMGMKPHGGEGSILADEMGLGKTLQVIALLWTLLKQNPVHEQDPVIKKALIVCPVTLISNWRKEFRKWLGDGRVGVFVVDGKKNVRLRDFTHGRAYNIMIIGYEKLRLVQEDLQKGAGIDIVIADEGHRLKTAQNKSAQAIKSLSTERRIILSGTPLQNDLSEFYFMVDFVNPGLLSKASTFKREFEVPIMKSRQPDASKKEVAKGGARSAELATLTSMFILRRTADIIAKYLPPKTETILFCRPTSVQAAVYRKVLESPLFGAVLNSSETAFQLINILKKLCNSPVLLRAKAELEEAKENSTIANVLENIPPSYLKSAGASGKIQVLDDLLHALRTHTNEKVVIVSHYTSTMDIIGNLLSSLGHNFLRLDGKTPPSKRQELVDKFNRTNADQCFAFLLSAKSGGAGLNLIGASRLVLFDVDWNPSTDEQAMARIHRDGQKRHCRIYRLLVQGALDEKIYQRQVAKRSLADSIVDGKVSASSFTREELRRLFQLDESDKCQTHELLGCKCDGRGAPPEGSALLPVDVADDEAEDEDEDLPSLSSLVKASQVDMDKQEREFEERRMSPKKIKGKEAMLALMQYQHIDTSKFAAGEVDDDVEALVDDDLLMGVLKNSEDKCKVGYLFTRTSS